MVEFLLRHGADPNLIVDGENIFWDLQYEDGETPEDNEIRLQIVQRMLEYRANSTIVPEEKSEDLISYTAYKIFNESGDPSWIYFSHFFILPITYGGRNAYYKPVIFQEFDRSAMKQYRFFLGKTADGLICEKLRIKTTVS